MINQLFRVSPSIEFIRTVLKCYGLDSLEDESIIYKELLNKIKTVDKLNGLDSYFQYYYLPCKYNIYTNNLTEKKAITILKHLLKCIDYELKSREKYIKGTKHLTYSLYKKVIPPKKIVISFQI